MRPLPRNPSAWLVAVCALGVGTFVATIGAAMWLYPGGTWFNRRAPGHSLARNYLCDLLQPVALNGAPAPLGSTLAQVGMLAIIVAIASFWWQVAAFASPRRSLARILRSSGLVGCACATTIPFLPSNQVHEAHIIAVVATFLPGIAAAGLAAWVCLTTPGIPRAVRWAAMMTLASAAVDGLAYGYAYLPSFGYPVPLPRWLLLGLPLLQRVATAGLLLWMAAVSLHTWRRSYVGAR